MARKTKKVKKIETENTEVASEKILEKQVKWVIFLIIGFVLLMVIIIALKQSSYNFEYNGVKFNKDIQSGLTLYKANVPVYDAYNNSITRYFNVDFRSDPRKLNDVNVSVGGRIDFISQNKTYISYNITPCEDNALAGANLGFFLADFKIDYKAGLDDIDYKNLNLTNVPYVNCQTNPGSTVLHISNGNENSIVKTSNNCYELTFKNCEILKVTEKFELELLKQYTDFYNQNKNFLKKVNKEGVKIRKTMRTPP